MSALPPVVAVVGPTATGRPRWPSRSPSASGGEVVNADSMQLYRGMDIGTAKPDLAERGGVPHHLLDLWHVREAGVGRRVPPAAPAPRSTGCARPGASRCWSAAPGCTCAPCSTSSTSPAPTPRVRARLEAELADVGPAALHARLAAARPRGRPRRSCRATDGGSSAPWRSSS